MAYYLGKDVEVYMTTESQKWGVVSGAAGALTFALTSGTALDGTDIVPYRASGMTAGAAGAFQGPQLSDVTAIDFSPAKMDEDISYMGKNTNLKAEVENEYVVTITKKKNNALWDVLFNSARYGGYTTSGGAIDNTENYKAGAVADGDGGLVGVIHDGLTRTKIQAFGYRLHLVLKDTTGGEVVTIRNACLNSHTVSLNADGTQEETAEFYSYVKPIYVEQSSDVNLIQTPLNEL